MNEPAEQPKCQIYLTPYEVDLRLSQLAIPKGILTAAVLQGEFQRKLATPDDFHATAGFNAWARTLREVRSGLRAQRDWHRGAFLQIPVAFSADETLAIAVSPGDGGTGNPERQPITGAKGPATGDAVKSSKPQGRFDFKETPVDLWYLVYSSDDEQLRAELSRPDFADKDNKITQWSERILLGRINPEPRVRQTSNLEVSDIDVTVRRRSM